MSAIFGYVHLDGRPADSGSVQAMADCLTDWGPDGVKTVVTGSCAFGFAHLTSTAESIHETQPVYIGDRGLVFTAGARLDNREDLCRFFRIPTSERPSFADGRLVLRAWETWGESAPEHLYGDWSFAVWNEKKRRLFMARDHLGITGLYYAHRPSCVVFSSSMKALLAHPSVPKQLDRATLATFLTLKPHMGSGETFFKDVSALRPAHSLWFQAGSAGTKNGYWKIDNAPDVRLPSDQAYLERFHELFEHAVNARLRSIKPVGSTLSGGLDSGAVTAMAARILEKQGRRLSAFTSVPRYPADDLVPGALDDEWALASLVAKAYPNIDHVAVGKEELCPLTAVDRSLNSVGWPIHAAGNLFWILAILDAVRSRGLGVLLTGQMGNGTVSWNGGRDRIFHLFKEGCLKEGIRSMAAWKKTHGISWPRTVKQQLVRPLTLPYLSALGRFSPLTFTRTMAQNRFSSLSTLKQATIADWEKPLEPRETRVKTIMGNGFKLGTIHGVLSSHFCGDACLQPGSVPSFGH